MYKLVLSSKFKRAFRKFASRNANLQAIIEETLVALEKDVFKRWQNFSDNGSVIYAQPIVTMVAKK